MTHTHLTDTELKGILDDDTKSAEFSHPFPQPDGDGPTLVQMRDAMGWPAKDITTHELVIEPRVIKGHIPVTFYRKKSLVGQTLPVLVFVHGGGFFGGSVHNVEQISRTFADLADIAVASVEYRLAPENPFPAALLDVYNVIENLATDNSTEFDKSKIYLAGDSAGGNLTITTALLDHAHLKTNYITKIVAYYPVVAMDTEGSAQYFDLDKVNLKDPAEQAIIRGYIGGFAAGNAGVEDWYGGNLDHSNSLISPLNATPDDLKALPPLKTIIGEFDPLLQQCQAFHEKLAANDIAAELLIYPGLVHAFMDKIGVYDQAKIGVQDALDFLEK